MDITLHRTSGCVSGIIEIDRFNDGIDDALQGKLNPWIRAIATADTVKERRLVIHDRWQKLSHPGTMRVRDLVMTYAPKSIVVARLPQIGDVIQSVDRFSERFEESPMQYFRRLFATESAPAQFLLMEKADRTARDGKSGRDLFIIPPPSSPDLVREATRQCGVGSNSVLCEFLSAFGGMSEHISIVHARFCSAGELSEQAGTDDDVLVRSGWSASVVFYGSIEGDVLYLHESGKLAWGLHELHEIRELALDLNAFLEAFVEYRETSPVLNAFKFLEFVKRRDR